MVIERGSISFVIARRQRNADDAAISTDFPVIISTTDDGFDSLGKPGLFLYVMVSLLDQTVMPDFRLPFLRELSAKLTEG